MNRRDYLEGLAVAGAAGLAGCGGNSEGTPTLPETVQEAMEEAEETDTETASTAASPGAAAVPLDWRTYARNATNTRRAPEQSNVSEEYEVNWMTDVPDNSRVVAGGERLFVQANRDNLGRSLSAIDPSGEVRWTWEEGEIGGTVYADGVVAGLTRDGDVLVLDAETGERTGLVTDVGTEPSVALNQVSESGLFVTVSGGDQFDPSEMVAVDLLAGETVHESTVESMAWAYETLIEDGEIILIGAAPVESMFQDNPMMVQRRDLETGDVLGEFERSWLRDDEMGYPDWSTVDGGTVFTVTSRSGMQYDQEHFGMVSYETDGTLNWKMPKLFPNTGISPPLLDDERVYLIAGDSLVALDRETGEQQWQYETTAEFSPGSIVTDETLLVPDQSTEGDIRVHSVDCASGDADRVQLYTSDEDTEGFDTDPVRLRPASEGIYVRGSALTHLVPGSSAE